MVCVAARLSLRVLIYHENPMNSNEFSFSFVVASQTHLSAFVARLRWECLFAYFCRTSAVVLILFCGPRRLHPFMYRDVCAVSGAKILILFYRCLTLVEL